jgi:hypothetical protein
MMEETMFTYRKQTLVASVIAALGVSASAEAGTISASWTGAYTMLTPNGNFVTIPDNCFPGTDTGGSCLRGPVNGTLSYDTASGTGSITVAPFSFGLSGNFQTVASTFQWIGDGFGGPGSLVLGNMSFNWNGSNGIPMSLVWDASGLLSAIDGGLSVGQNISGGALPASDNTENDSNGLPGGTTYPIGPALLATTSWNTTKIGTPVLGTNPSGTLPLIADTVVDITNGDLGVGGSPMPTFPFPAFNANFDILSMTVTSCTPDICPPAVPIPATVWLFGSGLAGLVSLARRKREQVSARAG